MPNLTHRYQHINEAELLARYQSTGDKQWIGTLLMRYTTILLGVCKKYMKDDVLAEDMVQQVMLKVLSRPHTEMYDNFGGWLYTITKNTCLTQLNKIQYHLPIEHIEDNDKDDTDIKYLLDREDLYQQLEDAIALLNDEQKKCVQLFFLQQKSYQEIAVILGMDIKQVKSHIQNGKRNIKVKMNIF